MKQTSIVMKYGATNNSITVDGVTFDRSVLDKGQQYSLRNIVTGALGNLWGQPVKRTRSRKKTTHAKV